MNTSGITPFEYKVVVKPKEVTEMTEGGIVMPEQVLEREKYGNAYGVIVAVGYLAFEDPDWGLKPKVGDEVLFDKYAGTTSIGKDGADYRIMNDKEIVARIDK